MQIAYFDCFSGISGDMTLGALLHAGLDEATWRAELSRLDLPGCELRARPVVKSGLSGVQVEVIVSEADTGHGRHLAEIAAILNASGLSELTRRRALGVFTRLARAEAKIHQTTPEAIHFHEVGAVDAIVDIVGVCLGLELLEIERVYVSSLPLNQGWVECAHGVIPVPAPATLELLTGFTLRPDARSQELITPTGAAILAEFAERTPQGHVAPVPPMTLRAIGYGAGKCDTAIPNLLRVLIGEAEHFGTDRI